MEGKVERIGNDEMNVKTVNFLHSLRSDNIYMKKKIGNNEINARTIVGKKVFALVTK